MAAWITQNNPKTLEEKLSIADDYGRYSYAATGWLQLNENSDREFGDYFFYQVQKDSDGRYFWMPIDMYQYETETIVPLSGVNNTYMQHFTG